MNLILIGIGGYVVVQLAIGFLASRRIHSEADYLVAGRRLGYPLSIFSIFATWFGAEACLGSASGVYDGGMWETAADPFGYGLCILAAALLLAAPLWRRGIATLADLFGQRYSVGVERLAALLMIPTSVFWAAAQIRAFGQILSSASDALTLDGWILTATAVVLIYTIVGGLLADAWTDLLQGALLLVGLVVMFFVVSSELGGVAAAWQGVDRERLGLRAPDASLLATVNAWALPIVGSFTAQELVARMVAARSPQVARRSGVMAAGMYLLFGTIPVFLGLVARDLPLSLEHSEQLLPVLAEHYLPAAGRVLFVGVLVSAILSTVDSALLVCGSLLSRNLVGPSLPHLGERARLRAARAGVFVFGVLAWWLARGSESVLGLVEQASAFGSAGVVTITLFGLYSRFGGPWAAAASLVAGTAGWIVAAEWLALELDYLTALAAAVLAYVLVAWVEPRRTGVPVRPSQDELDLASSARRA